MKGIEHVYSVSRPGMAVVTVQFKVGEDRTDAIVRLFSKVLANQDWLPANLGVGAPIVKPKGIDDVPIITATLWSKDPARGAFELGQVAHAIEQEIKRVPGTKDVYTVGAPRQAVRVLLDPQALAGHGIDLADLRRALQGGNLIRDNLAVTADNQEVLVQAGTFLSTPGGDRRPGGRAARRAPGDSERRGQRRARPGAAPELCLDGGRARRPPQRHRPERDHAGGDRRRRQAGGGQRRRGGRAGHRALRPARTGPSSPRAWRSR